MYKIVLSKQYKKSLRKLKKSGRHDIHEIEKVVSIIASGKKLEHLHRDHALSGDMLGYRECHIKSDLLLVYYIDDDELILALVNIGSHSDLF